jgi:hypothetical protein
MSSHDLFSVSGTSPTPKKRTAIPKADFRIENHGSVCLIVPLCASGREWLDEHLGKDNGYQPYWPTAIVEPRYLPQINMDGDIRDAVQFVKTLERPLKKRK